MITFQDMLSRLAAFWQERGCIIHQGYDIEVGAGTFNPATFLRCLGPEPYHAAYIEPCRRPDDGRYGENPNRVQHYYQYQVVLKPSPLDIQRQYLLSLEAIGLDLSSHDIRFVHDDWESPTLGASGLGWEVWIDGMEVTQFTYFQTVGGLEMSPITGEITYGLERLAMFVQNVDNFFDIIWNDNFTYHDIYHRNEIEWSHYNFEEASTDMWSRHFDDFEKEANRLMEAGYVIPAYDFVMKASHAFNILDARGVISVTERTGYIGRIRTLARSIAEQYVDSREKLGFPLLKHLKSSNPTAIDTAMPSITTEKEDYILEIGSEELPATFVPIGMKNLKRAIGDLLKKEDIPYDDIIAYGTPRRLAILIINLKTKKDGTTTKRRGPAISAAYDSDGKPTKAAAGFFRSINIDDPPSLDNVRSGNIDNVAVQEQKQCEYLFATITTSPLSTAKLLADSLPHIIATLDFPKKMRWSDIDFPYARPMHWIVSLFGTAIVHFTVANITAGNTSRGHRQRNDIAVDIADASNYITYLRDAFVMADPGERQKTIEQQLTTLGVTPVAVDVLMPQVVNLCEWPELLLGTFNHDFLTAPQEVLTSEMVEHQKYFPATSNNKLTNTFVITADNTPSDDIRHGNEKVLSARLADGVFLYQQDLKTPIDTLVKKLKTITFQKNQGTVYDKTKRISAIVSTLHTQLNIGNLDDAKRAASLCKADLASELVNEFPELQGIAGKYYATHHKEKTAVALAIEEHYMPRKENAPLPSSPEGILVSIADKMDNIICCFQAGLAPTSSKDPYALRRQALGIIKTLIAHKLHLPFTTTLQQSISHKNDGLVNSIKAFFVNRIKTVFQDYGLAPDEIAASLDIGFDDIYDVYNRVQALHKFRATHTELFKNLHEVYRRAYGQIKDLEPLAFSPNLLKTSEEISLHEQLTTTQDKIHAALTNHNYDNAYQNLAHLQPTLAAFWDNVTVLDPDITTRNNRLALLQQILALFLKLLNFHCIVR